MLRKLLILIPRLSNKLKIFIPAFDHDIKTSNYKNFRDIQK
jgi:hypothetical protein